MANGPPTPPPTTEAEIQDEARLNQAAQGATTTVPPPAPTPTPPAEPDVFQEVFPVILELASQSNFRGLIQAAENATINSDPDSDRRLTRLLVLGPLIIAYLIVDDLPPARFALTRLPDIISSTPLINSLVELLASTWNRKHVSVYSRAQELRNLVNVQGFFDGQLASLLTSLLSIFVQSFRQRTVALLSVAYTSLPVPLAQRYLGMEQVELLAAAQNEGWMYDASTNVLIPKSARSTTTDAPELGIVPFISLMLYLLTKLPPAVSSLSSFHFVADSVAKLEL